MTTTYLFAAGWGLVLLISFIGYGKSVRRVLFPTERVGWAESAAWGIAFIIALGGWLNLAGIVSPPLIISLVVFGVAFTTFEVLMQKSPIAECLKKHWLQSKLWPNRYKPT